VAVLLGLLSAFGWGVADFLVRPIGRGIGLFPTILLTQLVGLAVLTLWLALDWSDVAPLLHTAGPGAWAAALLAVPINLAASYALFRGLTHGTVGIVSPLAATFGAVTTGLAAATGEPIGGMQAAGIGCAVGGIALISAGHRPTHAGAAAGRSIGLGALAALGFGIGFWLQGRWAVPALGPLVPVWVYYLLGMAILLAVARALGQTLNRPLHGFRLRLAASTTLGLLGYVALTLGLRTGQIATVAVLSSLASGITTLLARIFLGERLAPWQWTGVVGILIGIGLINAGR